MSFWAFVVSWGGGYAGFILPAYGVSALGLGLAVILSWRGWRAAKTKLAALEGKS